MNSNRKNEKYLAQMLCEINPLQEQQWRYNNKTFIWNKQEQLQNISQMI